MNRKITLSPSSLHNFNEIHAPQLDAFTGPNVARIEHDPRICFAEAGGDDGDKTFTQEELNRILAKETKKLKRQVESLSGLEDQLEDMKSELQEAQKTKGDPDAADKVRELKAQLRDQKREHASAMKSLRNEHADKLDELTDQSKQQERAFAKITKERDTAVSERDAANEQVGASSNQLKRYILDGEIGREFDKLRVIPEYRTDAMDMLHTRAKFKYDEADASKLVGVTVGDKEYATIGEAAGAFIESKPIFRSPVEGGAGARPTGSGAGTKPSADLGVDSSLDEFAAAAAEHRSKVG